MDPLAKLHDIQLAEPVHQYPIALGYWLLLLIAVTLIIGTFIFIKRYKAKRQVRNRALKHLAQNELSNDDIMASLKWVCLHYFKRDDVAQLHGNALLQFMKNTTPLKYKETLNTLLPPSLDVLYQPEQPESFTDQFKQSVIFYLKHAFPITKAIEQTNANMIGESSHD